ncbi:Arylsulfatase [Pontiella desulfatans]|uniref:Arylsulfatase n=1 Tax=Pontiella desulfatans TaxID=2750659 RepID=A0A6C2U847_PONDE|nr:sulfatase-like hydrolase/transferase [Pontiella desulfatans]SPS74017.1 sulfatase S1_23 [Kiritimatiellales bacterium]VGO16282.1 Arylsulfatase [Pontiella desulfatans]
MFKPILSFISLLFITMASAHAAPRPNIILVMADDMGWGDPSYNSTNVVYADGTPHPDQGWIHTPIMDDMAASGLRFDRFYAASAVCSPTRASCLTGRHPSRVGIGGANSGKLGFDETPLSTILSDAGYATGHYGKWHMGTMTTLRNDANRGAVGNTADYSAPWHFDYDVCFATESKVPTYNPYSGGSPLISDFDDSNFYGTRYWRIPDTWNETSGEGDVVLPADVNDAGDGDDSKLLVDQAIPFMQDAVSNNTPFFLVLWFHTPHKPIIDPDGVSGVNSSDAAKDSIEDLDTALGRLRDQLTTLGVRSNTMFWVTSDNGPENGVNSFNETDTVRSIRSGRYRDRKGKLFDGGIIVPGILEWPDVIPSPMSTDIPVVTSDYYPTILDYLELSVPNQKPLDGISLRPIINGTATERTKPIGFKLGNDTAWMNDRYKLVDQDTGWLLFDMENIAPGEEPEQTPLATETNVASQPQEIQDIYNTMLSEYNAWISTVNTDTPYVHASQPTVSLSTPLSSVAAPFNVTATFSKEVTQLNAGEFAVINGTPSNLTGSGTNWTVTITPSAPGTVNVSLPEGSAIDTDGNINAASGTLDVTYINASAPDVVLSTPTNVVTTNFSVTALFTEIVTGLDATDFTISNGAASNLSGGPTNYTVLITPATPGTVTVSLPAGVVQDSESNGNNASNPLNITYDPPIAPTVVLTGPSTASGAYAVSLVFSENVTGLDAADLNVLNGSATNLTGTGDSYSATITPAVPGNVTVSLPAGVVTDLDDALGNAASAPLITSFIPSGSGGHTVDILPPQTAGQTVDSDGLVPGHQSNNLDKFSEPEAPFTATNLFVRGASNSERKVRAFARFDLSSISGMPVERATLSFNGFSLNSSSNNDTDIEVIALASDWSENGVPLPTYTHPVIGSPVNGGSVTTGLVSLVRDYTFDLTDMVRNWTDGTWTNYGLRIQLSNDGMNNGVGIRTEGEGTIALSVSAAPLNTESDLGPGSSDFTLRWNALPGASYSVEATDHLTNAWEVATNLSGSYTGTNSFTFEGDTALYSNRFYRVVYPAAP